MCPNPWLLIRLASIRRLAFEYFQCGPILIVFIPWKSKMDSPDSHMLKSGLFLNPFTGQISPKHGNIEFR
jgi:hypothetical protein